MKKKLFCILLSLCMLLCYMPQAAWADSNVNYWDWDANSKTLVEKTLPDTSTTVTVTTDTNEWKSETASWYVVEGTVTISSRVTVTGNVNLLLKDSCNLTVNGGISVPSGNSLTIYAQSNTGDSIGTLTADASYETTSYNYNDCAGIGGDKIGTNTGASGTITINGGRITAKGVINGAGIGGGYSGDGSNITINGGIVTATGGGAGIGGGFAGKGSNITINGGIVTAEGHCGIGGGDIGEGSHIYINGGIITATGSSHGAGIGGGKGKTGSNIYINGGTVTATGGSYGAGIGGGAEASGEYITITGGRVTATGGNGGRGYGAAGIGGGGDNDAGESGGGSGSHVTITGGEVAATGSNGAAGIGGGGANGSCGDIKVSGNAQLKVKGTGSSSVGAGAGIGNGGVPYKAPQNDLDPGTPPEDGAECAPDTSVLGENGYILYYAPDADMDTDQPTAAIHYGNTTRHEGTLTVTPAEDATCTTDGRTIGLKCTCGQINIEPQTIKATGHTWENDKCTICGYTKPVAKYGSSRQYPTVAETTNGTITLSSNGRTATITPDAGYEIASVTVNGEGKETVAEITGLRTGDKIAATFQKTKQTLNAETKAAVSSLSTLKARSSRTAKGNVKVVAKLSSTEKAQIAEFKGLGYTVKYRFYRSTKKSSGYKAMLEKSSATYINTYGKDSTRYYYKAQIRVYDTDGTLIAKTELKDCKYATRIF